MGRIATVLPLGRGAPAWRDASSAGPRPMDLAGDVREAVAEGT